MMKKKSISLLLSGLLAVTLLTGCGGAGSETAATSATETTAGQALELVTALRKEGYSLRDAVRQVSKETGVGKNELYDLAVEQGC